MDHTIKVKIANRIYNKVIHSEEEEATVRQAVADLNETVAEISRDYPWVSAIDIMTIAALNIGIDRIEKSNKLGNQERAIKSLDADLQDYIDSLK